MFLDICPYLLFSFFFLFLEKHVVAYLTMLCLTFFLNMNIMYKNDMLTSTSEGIIFIIPTGNSLEPFTSQLLLCWDRWAWGSISFLLLSPMIASVARCSFDPELEACRKLLGGGTTFISSNFSSNWLRNKRIWIWSN